MSGSVGSIFGILLPDLRHFNSSVIPHWGLMTLAGRWLAAGGRDRPPRTACCWSSWSPASYAVVCFGMVLNGMVCYGMVWYGMVCTVHIAAHWAPGSAAFVALTYPLMSLPMLSIYISCPVSTNLCLHLHSITCFCFPWQMQTIQTVTA